jgi:hypothetical protein
MSGTGTQTQLSEAEIQRRIKILNDIAKRVEEIQEGASKSVNSLLLVAKSVIEGNETGNVVEHAEKMTALFGGPANLNQCSAQKQAWEKASAAAAKSHNFATAGADYSAYIHCLGTLRIVAFS